jgi:sugar lactone lactonase YvrE
VTDADWDALTSRYREFTNERRPQDLPYMNRFLAQVPRHETQPAFGWLEVDVDGRLWVAEYNATGRAWSAELWDVFDVDGRWLGRVSLPNGIQPLAIGADYVIGKRLDEYDVEFVGVYRLTRAPST